VLIVGGRYGSIDDRGLGFTEKEYRPARDLKIPILGFLLRRNINSRRLRRHEWLLRHSV